MAETTPELNLFKLSMNPLQNYLSIDITQVNGNGLEVERFSEKNGILDDLNATHKVNILKQFIQCLRRLYQQSISCSRLSSSQITCLRNQLSFSDKSKRTNGIHSLANLYCYALTNEKWQNYSEELPIEDIQCSGHPDIALDILKVMTKNSTNTKEVFLHPFYWNDVRRIDFLCDAYNYINSEIKKNTREYQGILRKFNMYKVEGVIPDKGWNECLRLTVDERSGKDIGEEVVLNSPYRLHSPDSIYDLMRFFRNRYLHRHEETLAVKLAFGGYPVEYLRFFTSRFPNLFMHVYRNMNRYLEQDTNLEPYLLDDLTILPESFNSSEAEGGPVKEDSPDVPLSRNQRWTSIAEGIKYDRESCYREGYKVFDAIRQSGGAEEEITVKFVLDNTVNKREIDSLWATIGHENVVKYLQSGYCKFEGEESIFIAMEKCEKDTLFEKIQAGNWSYDQRKVTVYYIATGLQHLKEKGIVHRDLKPQNILYRGDVPVISDFGLSKRILPNKSKAEPSGTIVGTNGWRAPEISMEKGMCTFSSDIYSAGLVNFYTLTNGKHPFGDDPEDWQTSIKQGLIECNLKALKEIGVFDWTLAFDMIDLMLQFKPFFWPTGKRLEFIVDTRKCIEDDNSLQSEFISKLNKREGKYGNEIKDEMENWKDQSSKKIKINWDEKLSFTFDEMQMIQDNFNQQNVHAVVDIDAMTRKTKKAKKAKEYEDSVTELLRFIRNRSAHNNGDKKEGTINQTEDQFLKYFFDRFPHLFVYVYCKIKDNYYDEEKSCTNILAKYFPLLQPKIIRNEVNNDSLEIEWEPVICANHYKLEIYTNNSEQKQPVFTKNVGKETKWTQAFDDKFGYGTSYYAVVTAIGDEAAAGHENKRSWTCTKQKKIGN